MTDDRCATNQWSFRLTSEVRMTQNDITTQSNMQLLLSVEDDAAVLSCKLSVVDVPPNFQPKTLTLEGISDNVAKRELLPTPEIQGNPP